MVNIIRNQRMQFPFMGNHQTITFPFKPMSPKCIEGLILGWNKDIQFKQLQKRAGGRFDGPSQLRGRLLWEQKTPSSAKNNSYSNEVSWLFMMAIIIVHSFLKIQRAACTA